ncbi:hypothetical protein [Novosphingobium sp.]|jgi:hypothetical protein|uniref:hypothetical protein n=1 Tax=Novosphingobium sp. TaxID=1874826 RepID=UPI002FE1F11F
MKGPVFNASPADTLISSNASSANYDKRDDNFLASVLLASIRPLPVAARVGVGLAINIRETEFIRRPWRAA